MLKIEMIGNLGADCEKKIYNGETFYTLNIAHTNKYTNRETGEVTEQTTWVSATINWDAKNLQQYLIKGKKIFVRGDASLRLYTGHDGMSHAGLNLRVSELEICSAKEKEDAGDEAF